MKELNILLENSQTLDELLDDKEFMKEVDSLDYYNTIGKHVTEEDLKEYNNTHSGIDLMRHSTSPSNYDIPGTEEWKLNQEMGRKEWHDSKLAMHLKLIKNRS